MMPPKARTKELLVEHVDDETIVYDLDSKDVHCLSPFAATVFELCDGHTSFADIAVQAAERLSTSFRVDQVRDAVAQLEECRLLDEFDAPLKVRSGHTRREAVQKVAFAGAAAAFTAPLVTSIVAPSAAMAQNGNPAGCQCRRNSDCQSNHCCKTAGSNEKCNDGCCAADNNGTLCQCTVGASGVGQCATINLPDPGACGTAGVCTPSPASFNCAGP